MKLIDFRFVRRDGEKMLQVRHREVFQGSGAYQYHSPLLTEICPKWTDWEDVPLVDLDEGINND